MEPIRRHAASGGLVFGICNGFQVLTEWVCFRALMRNEHLASSAATSSAHEETDTPFTSGLVEADPARAQRAR